MHAYPMLEATLKSTASVQNILYLLFVILAINRVHPASYLIVPGLSQARLWIGVL